MNVRFFFMLLQLFLAPSLQKRLETHQITILGRNAKSSLSDLSIGTVASQQPEETTNEKITEVEEAASNHRIRTISASKDLTATSGASLSYGYQIDRPGT